MILLLLDKKEVLLGGKMSNSVADYEVGGIIDIVRFPCGTDMTLQSEEGRGKSNTQKQTTSEILKLLDLRISALNGSIKRKPNEKGKEHLTLSKRIRIFFAKNFS